MLIDWVRSGRTGKYLALVHGARTSLRSVRTQWPRAKYFPVQPSHSVNKYILLDCGCVFIHFHSVKVCALFNLPMARALTCLFSSHPGLSWITGKAWKLSKKICFSTKVAAADFNVLYRGCWFDLPQNTGQPWFSVFKSSRLTSMECNLRVISERGRPVKSRTDRWNDGPSDHFTSISHKVTSNK